MNEKAEKLLVIYASQTGNAEHIAKNISLQAVERGFASTCAVMDDYEKVEFEKQRVVVFVSSTTGDGDSPDNALKFWRYFRKLTNKDKNVLENMKITVLGLGDTNYTNFGAHPRKIEKKLQEAGACLFYKSAVADEVETLEATVDPWIANLWTELDKIVSSAGNTISTFPKGDENSSTLSALTTDLSSVSIEYPSYKISLDYKCLEKVEEFTGGPKIPAFLCKVEYSKDNQVLKPWNDYVNEICSNSDNTATVNKDNPCRIKITSVQALTTKDAVKRTLLLEFDLMALKNWKYRAGDSIGIICPNNPMLVNAILLKLKLNGEQVVTISAPDGQPDSIIPAHIPRKTTVIDLFTYYLDITGLPRKAFFRMLAEYCSDENEKKMLLFLTSRQGMAEFRKFSDYSLNLYDILSNFKSAMPPINRLIDTLTQLRPRYYSAASAYENSPGYLKTVFNIVNYETDGTKRFGLCTPWLDEITGEVSAPDKIGEQKESPLSNDIYIPAFPNPSHNFHLPDDEKQDIIMVGPGTGVAPFVGFCEERKIQKQSLGLKFGQMWLLYGCRHKDRDFLFKKNLELFEKDGVLDKLLVARSRDPDNNGMKYVQDILKMYGQDIVAMMLNGAKFYVCGDAKGMAKEVADTLVTLLSDHAGYSTEDAKNKFAEWIKTKSYMIDVWT